MFKNNQENNACAQLQHHASPAESRESRVAKATKSIALPQNTCTVRVNQWHGGRQRMAAVYLLAWLFYPSMRAADVDGQIGAARDAPAFPGLARGRAVAHGLNSMLPILPTASCLRSLRRVQLQGQMKTHTTQGHGHTVVYFVGDSTLRVQYDELCALVDRIGTYTRIDARHPKATTKEKQNPVGEDHIDTCHGVLGGINHTAVFGGYHAAGYYTRGFVTAMYMHTRLKPTIIYFNGGLHLLHLYPAHRWGELGTHFTPSPARMLAGVKTTRPTPRTSAYAVWNHSEAYLAAFLYDTATAVGRMGVRMLNSSSLDTAPETTPPVLVYMTCHSICEQKFTKQWRAVALNVTQTAGSARREALQPCASDLTKAHHVEEQDAYRQCVDTSLTRGGAKKLNTRLLKTLGKWAQRHPATRVGVVDGFGITDDGMSARCGKTEDARHYPSLVFSELFALFVAAEAAAAARAPGRGGEASSSAAVALASATAVLGSCPAAAGALRP